MSSTTQRQNRPTLERTEGEKKLRKVNPRRDATIDESDRWSLEFPYIAANRSSSWRQAMAIGCSGCQRSGPSVLCQSVLLLASGTVTSRSPFLITLLDEIHPVYKQKVTFAIEMQHHDLLFFLTVSLPFFKPPIQSRLAIDAVCLKRKIY